MTFLEFRTEMFDLACFNIYQVYAWQPDFDRNNFTRWVKKGYLTRLRRGYFAFSEYKSKPGYSFYFANRIYRPSYISLHAALAFYGMCDFLQLRAAAGEFDSVLAQWWMDLANGNDATRAEMIEALAQLPRETADHAPRKRQRRPRRPAAPREQT